MKRIFIISNPATGQLNPVLPVVEELVARGNQVVLLSATSAFGKIQKMQARLDIVPQAEPTPSEKTLANLPLVFYCLGDGKSLADYTSEAFKDPERFHRVGRSKPGEIWGWLQAFTELVPPSSEDYNALVFRIRDLIGEHNPDMIITDNFSPFAVDGVRLSKRRFIATSPGAASAVASNISIWKTPMPMSGARTNASGLFTIMANLYFAVLWLKFALFHAWPKERRRFRHEVLGLEPLDIICDSVMTPTPGMLPAQVATISFNVANMDFYPPSAYDKSVYFVGPSYSRKTDTQSITVRKNSMCTNTPVSAKCSPFLSPSSVASTPTVADLSLEKEMLQLHSLTDSADPIKAWLDKAYCDNKRVLYINMGSIFYYTRKDHDNIVEAMKLLHDRFPSVLVLWKIPNLPYDSQPLPSTDEAQLPLYIRREEWLQSVETVLEHPALAVCMHHGGGNSYNEAVYFGVPQFCVSQWVDTHDIASYIQHSGVGLWADKSPMFDPEDMCEKLVRLLEDKDDVFRNATLSWRLRAMQAGGASAAANIVEAYMDMYSERRNEPVAL
ncbi:hypothetical protein MVES1_001538 [Malassezia vespertilionis]|uniref:Erythromycin biosynthesis protein CIII-like C-terminal domain-containing protein n=1 Tax=Malassezia vespertilionis TaxID=2020962 RepID=A0A2N1JCS5_9BASI|nr:uncharacterized protein MVES1_001538 [Malassezia vespertilionis]PKI84343.1 hypothetical protein MVES_001449 [Malassezia vespertilionis]WFD06196.1 hypothetical protein MVES1_001538 [Malassezia vespertilionis]